MATTDETRGMENRGLLTSRDREFLRDLKDRGHDDLTKSEKDTLYQIRSRIRKRIQRTNEDLELLAAAGEDDLVDEFHDELDRVPQLEQQLEQLRDELSEG